MQISIFLQSTANYFVLKVLHIIVHHYLVGVKFQTNIQWLMFLYILQTCFFHYCRHQQQHLRLWIALNWCIVYMLCLFQLERIIVCLILSMSFTDVFVKSVRYMIGCCNFLHVFLLLLCLWHVYVLQRIEVYPNWCC